MAYALCVVAIIPESTSYPTPTSSFDERYLLVKIHGIYSFNIFTFIVKCILSYNAKKFTSIDSSLPLKESSSFPFPNIFISFAYTQKNVQQRIMIQVHNIAHLSSLIQHQNNNSNKGQHLLYNYSPSAFPIFFTVPQLSFVVCFDMGLVVATPSSYSLLNYS